MSLKEIAQGKALPPVTVDAPEVPEVLARMTKRQLFALKHATHSLRMFKDPRHSDMKPFGRKWALMSVLGIHDNVTKNGVSGQWCWVVSIGEIGVEGKFQDKQLVFKGKGSGVFLNPILMTRVRVARQHALKCLRGVGDASINIWSTRGGVVILARPLTLEERAHLAEVVEPPAPPAHAESEAPAVEAP